MQFIINIPSHPGRSLRISHYIHFFFFFFPLSPGRPRYICSTPRPHSTQAHGSNSRNISLTSTFVLSFFCSSCAWRTSGHSSRCAMTNLAFATASCSTPLTCLMSGTSARWVQCFHALLWPRRISCMWTSTTFNICSYQGCVWINKLFGGTV